MHPEIAGLNWNLDEIVYDDGEEGIAVALFTRTKGEQAIGFRWLSNGKVNTINGIDWPVPYFGKSSEWILLPHDFAVPIAKVIIEKNAVGISKINKAGFEKMIAKLIEEEEIIASIGY